MNRRNFHLKAHRRIDYWLFRKYSLMRIIQYLSEAVEALIYLPLVVSLQLVSVEMELLIKGRM